MTSRSASGPMVAFYCDDFTGATAHLAGFHDAGLRARLFLDANDVDAMNASLDTLDVVGIAGISRSLAPVQALAEVQPAFTWFRDIGVRQVHFKVCSTFDSSPTIGNIGAVMELARRIFGARAQQVVIACPAFGRYTVFGQHFARSGDAVVRIDRHPMARHPSTPMTESDLRLHLDRQTGLRGVSIDLATLRQGPGALEGAWQRVEAGNDAYAVFDGLDDRDLDEVARLSLESSRERPLFSVAAQGLAIAMGKQLAAGSRRETAVPARAPHDVPRMLVLSGSAARRNGEQLARAIDQGWAAVAIDTDRLAREGSEQGLGDAVETAMIDALAAGSDVVVYSAAGPDDPTLAQVQHTVAALGLAVDELSRRIGALFARLVHAAVRQGGVSRLVLAGGDTSSHAMRSVDAHSLDIVAAGQHGGRLCRLNSDNPDLDGLEVMLKGGQVGAIDAFVDARLASSWIVTRNP
ncbi:four-carbon acid sugar kinase family protein [soil metagenome]